MLFHLYEEGILPALRGSLIIVDCFLVATTSRQSDDITIVRSRTVVADDQVDQVAFQTLLPLCVEPRTL
jgi:hypothetical protein